MRRIAWQSPQCLPGNSAGAPKEGSRARTTPRSLEHIPRVTPPPALGSPPESRIRFSSLSEKRMSPLRGSHCSLKSIDPNAHGRWATQMAPLRGWDLRELRLGGLRHVNRSDVIGSVTRNRVGGGCRGRWLKTLSSRPPRPAGSLANAGDDETVFVVVPGELSMAG